MQKFFLLTSVSRALAAMKEGWNTVFQKKFPSWMTMRQLQKLMMGQTEFSRVEWQECTVYDGYDENSDAIKNLWHWIGVLSDENAQKVLQLVTALTVLPVAPLPFSCTIKRVEPGLLPSARTCFKQLNLPDIQDYDKFVERCEFMLQKHGFGFV
jgi:E3 ubiquitin-protein ligase HUWE1